MNFLRMVREVLWVPVWFLLAFGGLFIIFLILCIEGVGIVLRRLRF